MMVRKYLLLVVVLLTFLCSAGDAIARYRVHKISGEVTLVNEGAGIPMERGTQVNLNDKVRIGENGSVSILDSNTSRVYVSGRVGLTTVAEIIMSARKQSESITRLVYNQAMESIKDETKKSISLGATVRGDEHAKTTTQLLYGYLSALPSCNEMELSVSLSLARIINDGDWFFRVENNSSELLYFGVLRVENGKTELMPEVGRFDGVSVLVVEPKASLELSQYVFANTDIESSYFLFATPQPFDMQELMVLFNSEYKCSDKNAPIKLLYAKAK